MGVFVAIGTLQLGRRPEEAREKHGGGATVSNVNITVISMQRGNTGGRHQMDESVGGTPICKALAVLSAFAGAGVRVFDLNLTNLTSAPVEDLQRPSGSLEDILRTIERVLQDAEYNQHNVISHNQDARQNR